MEESTCKWRLLTVSVRTWKNYLYVVLCRTNGNNMILNECETANRELRHRNCRGEPTSLSIEVSACVRAGHNMYRTIASSRIDHEQIKQELTRTVCIILQSIIAQSFIRFCIILLYGNNILSEITVCETTNREPISINS